MKLIWILIGYYLIVNIVAFALMGIDKKKAENNKWRIKENTLFISALIGGFVGYYIGMYKFHHKTSKLKFHACFYISVLIHIVILYFVLF